jgi:hypothetical protein
VRSVWGIFFTFLTNAPLSGIIFLFADRSRYSALLRVDNEKAFRGIKPLEFADTPALQETVYDFNSGPLILLSALGKP